MKDWASLTTIEEMEAATNSLLENAQKVGADTWQQRVKNQTPHCGFGESGSMFEEDTLGRIWFSHWMKGIYKLTPNDDLTAFDSVELLDTTKGFYSLRNNFVFKVRDRLLFSGDGGFFTYDEAMDRMTHCAEAEVAFGRNPYGVKLVESPDGNIWMLTNTDLQLARKQPGGQYDIDRQTFAEMKDKMIPGFEQFYFVNDSNLIINTDEGFAWIDLDKAKHPHPALKVSIHSLHLTSRQDSLAAGYIARQQEVPEYDYRDNSLRFEYAAPEYESPASVTYSCLLENYDNDWSRYTHANAKPHNPTRNSTHRPAQEKLSASSRLSLMDECSTTLRNPAHSSRKQAG